MDQNNKSTKVVTGEDTRWAYPHVWNPNSYKGGTPQYSVSLLIRKDDKMIENIHRAIQNAYEQGSYRLKDQDGEIPPLEMLHSPIRDGDLEHPNNPDYSNCYFINAFSPIAPGIVDGQLRKITDHREIYSGVFGRASVNFYAYAHGENRGIACKLNNLQKIRDGQLLYHRPTAAEDFSSPEDDFLA